MTNLKIVTNADVGTADIVGGDDWDAMATYVNDVSLHNVKPSSYIINKEGSTTYARSGLDNSILSQNSDSSVVIQAAINALTSGSIVTGSIFVKYNAYAIPTKLDIPEGKHGFTMVLENPYTEFDYSGTDACIEVGGNTTTTHGFTLQGGRIFCNSTSGTPVGVRIINCLHARLIAPKINGTTGTSVTGIELDGGGIGAHWNADIAIFAPYITSAKIGIRAVNGASNHIVIFGGSINGNTGPIAGSYGFDIDAGDTWHVYGTDIETMETAVRQRTLDTPIGSCFFNMRVEGCTNYVTTATANNTYAGSTGTTIITDTGSENDYTAPGIGQYNRARFVNNWFDTKTMIAPNSAGANYIRTYAKAIDANNDGLFRKMKVNGSAVEVQY